MTLDEFLDLLRQTPRDWYITVEGRIRRNDKYSIPCCPISGCHPDGPKAVIYYVDATRLLGLSTYTANDIIRAADNDGSADRALRARLLYYVDAARLLGLGDLPGDIIRAADNSGIANLSLRARLLDACGLAP